jgi:hypothetical protein
MIDFFVLMVRSPGLIIGPLVLLTALVAFAMCIRATLRADRSSARRALRWSAVPVACGVVGVIFGAIVCASAGQNISDAAIYLFATFMFGVFAAAVPALWAFVLLVRRPPAIA